MLERVRKKKGAKEEKKYSRYAGLSGTEVSKKKKMCPLDASRRIRCHKGMCSNSNNPE